MVRNSPSRASPMLLPLRVLAKTKTGVQPLPQEDASYRNTHTHTSGLLKTHLGRCLNPVHRAPWSYPQHLAVLFGVSAAELVDVVEVVRRDDEAVELAQVTLVCICQAVHAVIVHCGLTPHTPGGGTEARKPIRKAI